MTAADQRLERLADKLQAFAERSAAEGGVRSKLAEPLADDAAFVRKMKPSLIKARAKGEAPTDSRPERPRVAPSSPQLGKRPAQQDGARAAGPNPWLVAGVCFAIGIFLAKWIDWRGHAHPRD
jgi:hypothetical protein